MADPLKLLVFPPFYPPHIGGLESHADEFNRHLSKEGVKVSVFTPRLPNDATEKETLSENVHVYRFPAFEPIHNYPVPKLWSPTFWKLLRKASSPKPDIVLSRTRFFSTSLFALLFSKIKHIPLVHIEHGSDFAKFNGNLKTLLGKYYDLVFGRAVLHFTDKVIANSFASAAFVKKLSGRGCTVIYRGVEVDDILAVAPDKNFLEKNRGKIIIGFIGRLIDGKGAVDLLAALSKIQEMKFIGVFIGNGPEREKLEREAKKYGLQEKIFFLGHREHTETIALLKTFDIFVNPSYTEGLPTTIIEAALCKKAIVATDVGGTPEIITGNGDGFLMPAGNIKALCEKLEQLIAHPEIRTQFGEQAFLSVQDKFDWKQSTKHYLKIFENTLSKPTEKISRN